MPKIQVIVSLGFLFLSLASFAQNNNQSPFSRYGVGDLEFLGSAGQRFTGGTGIAISPLEQVNMLNPAHSVFLKGPVFNVNTFSKFTEIAGEDFSFKQSHSALQSISFAFPVKQTFGFQFGLRPYSAVNYDLTSTTQLDTNTVFSNYTGTGGIKNVFLGLAYDLFADNDSLDVVVSGQFDHFFGPLNQSRAVYTDALENGYGIKEDRTANLNGSNLQFSSLFNFYPKKDLPLKMSVGVVYQPQFKISGKQEYFAYTFLRNFSQLEVGKDTIQYLNSSGNSVTLPEKLSLGLGFNFKEQLQFGLDYSKQSWSNFEQNLSQDDLDGSLTNYTRISAGLQYTPSTNILFNEPIWNFITYSAGIWKGTGYLSTQRFSGDGSIIEEPLSEFGTSFGLRIPFRRSKSNSSLQLGVEYRERGDVTNNLIQEKSTRIIFGLSLCPNFIDRWFYKRKYD